VEACTPESGALEFSIFSGGRHLEDHDACRSQRHGTGADRQNFLVGRTSRERESRPPRIPTSFQV
jgi:hypothetical protein